MKERLFRRMLNLHAIIWDPDMLTPLSAHCRWIVRLTVGEYNLILNSAGDKLFGTAFFFINESSVMRVVCDWWSIRMNLTENCRLSCRRWLLKTNSGVVHF